MRIKTIFCIIVSTMALTMQTVAACTETGRNCQYSSECCSGACSRAFGFCLHR